MDKKTLNELLKKSVNRRQFLIYLAVFAVGGLSAKNIIERLLANNKAAQDLLPHQARRGFGNGKFGK